MHIPLNTRVRLRDLEQFAGLTGGAGTVVACPEKFLPINEVGFVWVEWDLDSEVAQIRDPGDNICWNRPGELEII